MFVGYLQGSALGNSGVYATVYDVLTNPDFNVPLDENGIYVVMTSADVTEAGFCTVLCGWHSIMTVSGVDIKLAFVGDPVLQCPRGCNPLFAGSNARLAPHSEAPGADAIASVLVHELEEAAEDPEASTGWIYPNCASSPAAV